VDVKSLRHVAGALRELGHRGGYVTVATLMRAVGYSLQANVKPRGARSIPTVTRSFATSTQPPSARSRPATR
jgi:hypothetical protein